MRRDGREGEEGAALHDHGFSAGAVATPSPMAAKIERSAVRLLRVSRPSLHALSVSLHAMARQSRPI